jgi:hypothetical protein
LLSEQETLAKAKVDVSVARADLTVAESEGSLAGALVGWGVPKDRAIKYEEHVKGGKILVVVRSIPKIVAGAHSLLAAQGPDHINVYEPPAS